MSVPMRKLLTGEPYAGKPPVRFGGKGDRKVFLTPIEGEKSPRAVDQTPRVSEETLLWNGKKNLAEIGTPECVASSGLCGRCSC